MIFSVDIFTQVAWGKQQLHQRTLPMKIKRFLLEFVVMFVIVLIVNVAVSYLYGLIAHGAGTIAWDSAFAVAIALGIVLPWVRRLEPEQQAR